jgi:UDP-3-O-[3-hydroxymyristoyl] glucosamine N-acyltransferase
MSKTLYIYGCSGIGKAIIDSACRTATEYTKFVFVDDDENKIGGLFYNAPVISFEELLLEATPTDEIIMAFFKPADVFTRSERAAEIGANLKAKFVSVIDPSASVSPSSKIGVGVYVAANVVIDSDAVVGEHSVLLFNSVVSREVHLADSCFLSAGVVIKGSVKIAKSSFCSANAVITKNIRAHAFVNAGVRLNQEIVENSIVSERLNNITVDLGNDASIASKKLRFLHP